MTVEWLIAGIIILIGTSVLSYYMGRQSGYEYGFNDGEEVGYVEGYLDRNLPGHNHIPGRRKLILIPDNPITEITP